MFQVEMRAAGEDIVFDNMAKIREWLDSNRVQPSTFRYNFEDTGLVFRVDFAIEAQAVAFAHAFGGELLTGASPARAEAA